jgi:WD40 repeat protein
MRIRSMTFAADGRTLALGCEDKSVRLWDLGGATPRERLVIEGLPDIPWRLDLSPDGKLLAVGLADNTARLWDLSGAAPREWAVLPIGTAKDQKHVSESDLQWLRKDALRPGDPVQAFATRVRFFPDGKTLLCTRWRRCKGASYEDGRPLDYAARTVDLWDVSGPSCRASPLWGSEPPDEFLNHVELHKLERMETFSSDSRLLAAATEYAGLIRLWDMTDKPPRKQRKGGWSVDKANGQVVKLADVPKRYRGSLLLAMRRVGDLAFSTDGRALLVVTLESRSILVQDSIVVEERDLATDRPKWKVVLDGNVAESWRTGPIPCILGPGGGTVAAITDSAGRSLTIWSVATGKALRHYRLPAPALHRGVVPLAFAPDGRHLAVNDDNGPVYILRLAAADATLRWCEQTLLREPNNVQALLLRGRLYLESRAGGGLEAHVSAGPRLPDGPPARPEKGEKGGQPRLSHEQAVHDLTAAIKLDPGSATPRVLRGTCHLWGGQLDPAVEDFGEAIRLDKKCVRAYYLRGLIHAARKEHARAVADFTKVIDLDPHHAPAFYQRGLAHAERDEDAAARKDLDEAFRLDPALAPAAPGGK